MARTLPRITNHELRTRLTEYVVREIAPTFAVLPAFPEMQEIIDSVGISKASSYREFPSANDFKIWAVQQMIIHADIYGTAVVRKGIVAEPSDVHRQVIDSSPFVERSWRAILSGTDHVRLFRIIQVIESLANEPKQTESTHLLQSMYGAHVTMIAERLKEGHKWFQETIEDPDEYATSMFGVAHGIALNTFNAPSELVQRKLFTAISQLHVGQR